MSVKFSRGPENVLFVEGDLDVHSVAEAIVQGYKLIRSSKSLTTIDLGKVSKIDSAGLAFVIELMKTARQHNTRIEFKNIPARMREVADVYGLSVILPEAAFRSA